MSWTKLDAMQKSTLQAVSPRNLKEGTLRRAEVHLRWKSVHQPFHSKVRSVNLWIGNFRLFFLSLPSRLSIVIDVLCHGAIFCVL